jgi:hypothetical protein
MHDLNALELWCEHRAEPSRGAGRNRLVRKPRVTLRVNGAINLPSEAKAGARPTARRGEEWR